MPELNAFLATCCADAVAISLQLSAQRELCTGVFAYLSEVDLYPANETSLGR